MKRNPLDNPVPFVSDWVTTITKIKFNDFWYSHSSRLAKKYLEEAKKEIKVIKNPDLIKKFQEIISKVSYDCEYLLAYEERFKKFKQKRVRNVIEKMTKTLVIIMSLKNMSLVHNKITINLMHFHSELSEIINWGNEPSFE